MLPACAKFCVDAISGISRTHSFGTREPACAKFCVDSISGISRIIIMDVVLRRVITYMVAERHCQLEYSLPKSASHMTCEYMW